MKKKDLPTLPALFVEETFELVVVVAVENATFLETDVAAAFVAAVFVADVFVVVGKGVNAATGDATEGEFCDAGDDDAAAMASAAFFLA